MPDAAKSFNPLAHQEDREKRKKWGPLFDTAGTKSNVVDGRVSGNCIGSTKGEGAATSKSRRVFAVDSYGGDCSSSWVRLRFDSPANQGGFPHDVRLYATVTLKSSDDLCIRLEAENLGRIGLTPIALRPELRFDFGSSLEPSRRVSIEDIAAEVSNASKATQSTAGDRFLVAVNSKTTKPLDSTGSSLYSIAHSNSSSTVGQHNKSARPESFLFVANVNQNLAMQLFTDQPAVEVSDIEKNGSGLRVSPQNRLVDSATGEFLYADGVTTLNPWLKPHVSTGERYCHNLMLRVGGIEKF